MNLLSKAGKSFRIYFSQRRREGITNIIYGGFSGLVAFEYIHKFGLFLDKEFLAVGIPIIISILLFFLDFFYFIFSKAQQVQTEINKLYNVLKETVNVDNSLVTESALNRIKKETKIIENLKNNELELESLQTMNTLENIYPVTYRHYEDRRSLYHSV